MNAFVVSGLVKCRAQLAGDIEKAHEALLHMVIDLENLDVPLAVHQPMEVGENTKVAYKWLPDFPLESEKQPETQPLGR